MTTFGKLTRFNFLKTKNTTQHPIIFTIYNSVISKHSKTKQRPPGQKRGLQTRRWRHTKVNARGDSPSGSQAFQHVLGPFGSQFVHVFYRKLFEVISSQTPDFFNDTQLHDIRVSIQLTRIQSNFCICLVLVAQRSKTIRQIPLVINEERRGKKRSGLCWVLVSTCLFNVDFWS